MKLSPCKCGAYPVTGGTDAKPYAVVVRCLKCGASTPDCGHRAIAWRAWQAMQSEAKREHLDN